MPSVPEHFYQQSAVVPFRRRDGAIEFLLITSRKKKRWVLPKGVREPELSFAESAAREALEEAGIEGTTPAKELGSYEYEKWGGTCTVKVFAMKVATVHEDWSESYRERAWLSPRQAASRVDEPELSLLLAELGRRLEAGETGEELP
jgi:phosphohistidine phosphatase